ncbi:hypothetical protein H4R19_001942 [Coemansia spiralis]|nr:hypothetical protein H4R19_001942 [Coemansia spiralis]
MAWFRPLTGLQRHRLTNALFVAGVASAIGTVTGSNLLGCPAASRDKRLDGGDDDMLDGSDTMRVKPIVVVEARSAAATAVAAGRDRGTGGKSASAPV